MMIMMVVVVRLLSLRRQKSSEYASGYVGPSRFPIRRRQNKSGHLSPLEPSVRDRPQDDSWDWEDWPIGGFSAVLDEEENRQLCGSCSNISKYCSFSGSYTSVFYRVFSHQALSLLVTNVTAL